MDQEMESSGLRPSSPPKGGEGTANAGASSGILPMSPDWKTKPYEILHLGWHPDRHALIRFEVFASQFLLFAWRRDSRDT
jgi:hypothetical protein